MRHDTDSISSRRQGVLHMIVLCWVCFLFIPVGALAEADPATKQETKRRMHEVYALYSDLRTYLTSDSFFNDAHEENIQKLLDDLGHQFSTLGHLRIQRNEPGFQVALKIMQEIFEESSLHFRLGNKQVAKWRADFATKQCIACHTRYEAAGEFMAYAEEKVGAENSLEQGDYFLATRQFGKAEQAYRAAFEATKTSHDQYLILTRLLTLYTRVKPDPQRAIAVLNELLSSNADLKAYESDEIEAWLKSLQEWQREGAPQTSPIDKAAELIRQAISSQSPSNESMGAVELLRASALLHQSLVDKTTRRKEALYLLSLSYSKLTPVFYDLQQSEAFAEQCIREFPGSSEAKKAFKIYRKMVLMEFPGSRNTPLPPKVQYRLNELKELAFEHPIQKDLSRL